MSTERKIEANRQNAQKSTGPKTPEGKAKVSQNAVTHGLTSKRPVLDIEDTAEFQTFVNELLDQLDPTNPLEFFFAKRAACQAWRIQRAQCYETLILDKLIKSASQTDKTKPNDTVEANPDISSNDFRPPKTKITDYIDVDPGLLSEDDPKSLLGQVLMDDFRNYWTLDKIVRYETRLENSMIRCLNKFKKVRESKMMNFTSLRQYYRGFQPRPQDFQDEPSVGGADPCVCPENTEIQNKLINTVGHPESPLRGERSVDSIPSNESKLKSTEGKSSVASAKESSLSKQSQSAPDILTQLETQKLHNRQSVKKAV